MRFNDLAHKWCVLSEKKGLESKQILGIHIEPYDRVEGCLPSFFSFTLLVFSILIVARRPWLSTALSPFGVNMSVLYAQSKYKVNEAPWQQ